MINCANYRHVREFRKGATAAAASQGLSSRVRIYAHAWRTLHSLGTLKKGAHRYTCARAPGNYENKQPCILYANGCRVYVYVCEYERELGQSSCPWKRRGDELAASKNFAPDARAIGIYACAARARWFVESVAQTVGERYNGVFEVRMRDENCAEIVHSISGIGVTQEYK